MLKDLPHQDLQILVLPFLPSQQLDRSWKKQRLTYAQREKGYLYRVYSMSIRNIDYKNFEAFVWECFTSSKSWTIWESGMASLFPKYLPERLISESPSFVSKRAIGHLSRILHIRSGDLQQENRLPRLAAHVDGDLIGLHEELDHV